MDCLSKNMVGEREKCSRGGGKRIRHLFICCLATHGYSSERPSERERDR